MSIFIAVQISNKLINKKRKMKKLTDLRNKEPRIVFVGTKDDAKAFREKNYKGEDIALVKLEDAKEGDVALDILPKEKPPLKNEKKDAKEFIKKDVKIEKGKDAKEFPKVETPKVETPVVETPVVETPVVETPVIETPVVETPVVETPVEEKTAHEEKFDELKEAGKITPVDELIDTTVTIKTVGTTKEGVKVIFNKDGNIKETFLTPIELKGVLMLITLFLED